MFFGRKKKDEEGSMREEPSAQTVMDDQIAAGEPSPDADVHILMGGYLPEYDAQDNVSEEDKHKSALHSTSDANGELIEAAATEREPTKPTDKATERRLRREREKVEKEAKRLARREAKSTSKPTRTKREARAPKATIKSLALASIDDQALSEITAKKILLAGETVFLALDDKTAIPSGFIEQAPREGAEYLRALFRKSTPTVHVAVDERLFTLPKSRFALAIDGYLNWGLSLRGQTTTVLIGGCSTRHGTSVEIVVFYAGLVQEIGEKNLPPPDDPIFTDAANGLLNALKAKYPAARFVQAAPLTDWGLEDVEYIGEAALKRLSYRPLVRSYRSSRRFVLPAAVGIAGLLTYAGMVGFGWTKYELAVTEYNTAMADAAIRDQGGIDTNFLDVMNARRFYMEQPRRQVQLTQEAMRVVRGIGVVPNVQILEIKLPAPSINVHRENNTVISPANKQNRQEITPDRTPDVWMSIAVPIGHDTAILQAKEVMLEIANGTGMSLRLAHQGWKEDPKARNGLGIRTFNIEGFIHD